MGTERLHANYVLCSDGNAIVPLTCFPCTFSDGNGTVASRSTFRITFVVVPFLGTERFYLKCSCLNATLQCFTFWTNTERSGTIAFQCERRLIIELFHEL